MITRPRVALTLLAALFLLALPAVASASVYQVNSTADLGKAAPGVECPAVAVGAKCTLRAAIEESNASVAEKDTILFLPNVFEGQLADTIEPATPYPPIVSPLEIIGGTCTTAAGPLGPCVGVSGPSGGTAFSVEADETTIDDLAISSADTGIRVDAKEFEAAGNWLGIKLDGSLGTAGTNGIAIGPNGAEATIGGIEAVQRNVIANSSTGLDIEGADDARVLGNWFGLKPDGTAAGTGFQDIELTDYNVVDKAERDEIGTELAEVPAESAECDGGCNVISGAGRGIDLVGSILQGETPATGPTTIRGNFIGLTPDGTGSIVNTEWGILAGGADGVTVGGYLLGETNYLSGGGEGISTENGEGFAARGNRLGEGPDGSELTRPGVGIFALDQSVGETANIEQNVVLANGVGIEQRGATGHITGNEVIGGSTGIYAPGEPGGGLLAGNYVEAPSEYGILVESPNNDVRENTIVEAGAAGIRVKPQTGGVPMNGTSVGGDTEEKENIIEGSGGPAIEIFEAAGEPGSTTEITRNRGSNNSGLFIDLVGGANEGIQPPVVSTALQSSATGTAPAGAIVRVFFKNSPEAGELGGFLAETEANSSGAWKVSYPTIAAGTLVTATQTNELHATSELAAPVAAASESSGGGGGGGGGGNNNGGGSAGGNDGGGNNGGTADKTPPDTKITKAPPKKTHKTTLKFKFTATEAGSTFQCKLDGKPFKPCRSPKTYKKLKPGKHVFKVRAIDRAGNVDPTPAKRKFTVLR
jgi:CSLREA domain-containing protein